MTFIAVLVGFVYEEHRQNKCYLKKAKTLYFFMRLVQNTKDPGPSIF